MGEVFGESEVVVVAFAFPPSGVVGGNEENVLKFEAFGLVCAEDVDGIVGFVIGAGAGDGYVGGGVIFYHVEKIGKLGGFVVLAVMSGSFGTENAEFIE